MFDATTAALQRSTGRARVLVGPRGLVDLAQAGSAKAMLPRLNATGPSTPRPEIVFLNTSGGLASGDRLHYELELGPDCRALATTQTAERAYRAEGPAASARVSLRIGAGAWLDWLPQETILYQGARLDRVTEVDLDEGAGCLLLEMLVLGRIAMGERPDRLWLTDRRLVRRAGRVLHHDAFALDDDALARQDRPALLAGARALATLAVIASDAPDLLARARAVLDEPGVTAAASAPPGRLVLRLLAADGWPLRRQVIRLLAALRPDPLPRIWQV